MLERSYLYRRKLQVIALGIGGLVAFFCWCHKAYGHVDLVHADLMMIVQEIQDDMNSANERDRREASGEFIECDRQTEPGEKHD